ncbi:MAG: alpha/beta hydrolase [Bacteroidetes bacterium]|nr:alpha/beta hydrolase [Bacteroidota bacterium]
MNTQILLFHLSLVFAVLMAPASSPAQNRDPFPTDSAAVCWWNTIEQLSDSGWTEGKTVSPFYPDYLSFYRLPVNEKQVTYSIRNLRKAGFRLFMQQWNPDDPKATVLVGHGYMDHTGMHGRLIAFLLERGYRVVTWDLPGHGLSDGPRGAIDSFSVYSQLFEKVVGEVKTSSPGPVHFIGHSTACLIAFNYLTKAMADPFDSVVFVAPLARHFLWEPGVFGHAVLKKTGISRLPRMVMNVSGDEAFNNLLRIDPLNSGWVPVSWPAALYKWENHRPVEPVSHRQVLILTGTHDTVVDADWNRVYYQQVFPAVKIEIIPGGRHHLLNEESKIRDIVYSVLEGVFP